MGADGVSGGGARFPDRATRRESLQSEPTTEARDGEEEIVAHQLISCDDHMDLGQLPADLWATRLPAALRDRAPHIEERDGQAVWICDDKVWGRWDGKPPAPGTATAPARPVKPIYNAFDRARLFD